MINRHVINSALPTLCVALSGITFGTIGYFGTELLAVGFSASQMLFWRFLLAGLCILPFITIYKSSKVPMKALFLCFIFGGLFYGLSTYCFFLAIPHIGSGVAMVLFYAFPVLVVFFSWVIDKKKLSKTEILAMTIIFPGIALLAITENAEFNTHGIILGLGSALFYGIYFFASKKFSQNLSPLLTSLMICLGNVLLFAVVGIFENGLNMPETTRHYLLFSGFVLIGTVLPLWFKKVNVIKASLISIAHSTTTTNFDI